MLRSHRLHDQLDLFHVRMNLLQIRKLQLKPTSQESYQMGILSEAIYQLHSD